MADPAYVTGAASQAAAAPLLGLVQEAAALAVAHFDQLPPGEEGMVHVLLNSPTGYGVITLGVWTFVRDAQGAVTLLGSDPEDTDHG
ncbi:hypothetical protein [Streptomyces sp. KAU_LT]|uniref:hypothetical protein n=1 Tax=Streptomyces sp. KAU_LT TaxID=3046669 RepID=UPI0024B7B05E|nr:hypothetical protein [Streptomyces sp. KAU_LT]MDI9829697.1 hypothetical protein [Streptomyces sp. KAU_LT]